MTLLQIATCALLSHDAHLKLQDDAHLKLQGVTLLQIATCALLSHDAHLKLQGVTGDPQLKLQHEQHRQHILPALVLSLSLLHQSISTLMILQALVEVRVYVG
ncbi:MAG: hypothetical protein EB015_23025 [Methylocystaceae bacterium]|nr:hypothetical protein [Methylocystaceae bacterium]